MLFMGMPLSIVAIGYGLFWIGTCTFVYFKTLGHRRKKRCSHPVATMPQCFEIKRVVCCAMTLSASVLSKVL
jgi:hypothetical protein